LTARKAPGPKPKSRNFEQGGEWSWTVRNGAKRQADRAKAEALAKEIAKEKRRPLNGGERPSVAEREAIRIAIRTAIRATTWHNVRHPRGLSRG
jgi:O-succinylbenzoate synthase